MADFFAKLSLYFQYPFVTYALVVSIAVAVCASLLGVTLVLKRLSYIGDGLSHVAFGAMAIAAVAGLTNDMVIVMPVTIICAIFLLLRGRNTKINGDASIAMLSVGALAIGYLLMNVLPPSSNVSADVCSTLFGSTAILTLSMTEVWVSIALCIVVLVVFILFYNKIFAVTFDQNFATATGTKSGIYNLIIAVVIAVVIVLAMKLVGSLLISALVVFPALSAMRVFKNFKSVTICSACISVVCTVVGLLASIVADTPVGSTIVAVDICSFIIFYSIGFVLGRVKKA